MKNTLTFNVEGMHCGNCAKSVERAAGGVSGVKKAKVDLEGKLLTVESKGEINPSEIISAVESVGFSASQK